VPLHVQDPEERREPVILGMWNYALKVADLETTAEFYRRYMGAEIRVRGEIYGSRYIVIRFGVTRVILFDKAPYEEELQLSLPNGFLHVVFEVDDFEAHIEMLRRSGVKFFMEPRLLKGEFGTRKIAFFEAPDGTRIEIMEVLEDSGRA
jgi:catechol 2,3-dioxygenase-like lactoylglutathione lyase family enzyme